MNLYGLKSLGSEWIWSADSEEEATLIYINSIVAGDCKTLDEGLVAYKKYCEDVSIDESIYWTKL